MYITKGAPEIYLKTEKGTFIIKGLQNFEEKQDKILLSFVDYFPEVKRGIMADIIVIWESIINQDPEKKAKFIDTYSETLLVYVFRESDVEGYTKTSYVFYKK